MPIILMGAYHCMNYRLGLILSCIIYPRDAMDFTTVAMSRPADVMILPSSIPELPACGKDCTMFEELTLGDIDDCAMITAWLEDSCMIDCSTAERVRCTRLTQ